jgi:hypothetical protein
MLDKLRVVLFVNDKRGDSVMKSDRSDRKHHHKKREQDKFSIFVKNEVTIDGSPRSSERLHNSEANITVNNETKNEDGCTGCFKGLFKALRR